MRPILLLRPLPFLLQPVPLCFCLSLSLSSPALSISFSISVSVSLPLQILHLSLALILSLSRYAWVVSFLSKFGAACLSVTLSLSLSLSLPCLSLPLSICLLLSRTLWVCAQLHPAYTFVPHAGPDSRKRKGVKPAGQQAERRSIATLCALRATAEKGFADLDGAWAGGLLQQGHVYRKAGADDFYVSLGFTFKATLLWRLEKCGVTWVQSESLDPSPPLE